MPVLLRGLLDAIADPREIRPGTLEIPAHPDEKRPPDEVALRHEAPAAAVIAAVPVVAHHEVVTLGHLPLDILRGSAGVLQDPVIHRSEFLRELQHHARPRPDLSIYAVRRDRH